MRCAALAAIVVVMAGPTAEGQVQMPDPKQMSGMPLPASDLPDGAVSVRVIRGELSNNITGHPVELRGGGRVYKATTDESGRARFDGIAPGTTVRAFTEVGSERLESPEFQVPARGGIRMMLVASAGTLAAGPAPPPAAPTPGMVVLGARSRFVIELADEALQVYYLLDIQNTARAPVTTPPVVFPLPAGADHATILEGSTPQAIVKDAAVTVTGPFQPGSTLLQFAYVFPFEGPSATIVQRLPVALQQLSVLSQKRGEMHLGSPQITNHRDQTVDGQTFIVATGGALPAGGTLTLQLSGLPHHSLWPRRIALGLAIAILGLGALAAWRVPRREAPKQVAQLERRREHLLNEILLVEQRRQSGEIDEHAYASRRQELIGQLERIYRSLDSAGAADTPRASTAA
jgi:hypothetical protein